MIKKIFNRLDIIIFSILVIFFNLHLLGLKFSNKFIFIPDKVLNGEWYRIITHPFVHLSHYHFILDVGAFYILYLGFEEKKIWKKIFYFLFSLSGSLIITLILPTNINQLGLCGLSGIAHGLMAINCIEIINNKKTITAGIIGLIILLSKSIYEAITGSVFLSFLHFGMCGSPLAISHLGGVISGVIGFIILNIHKIDFKNAISKINNIKIFQKENAL